jgi:hypothetical protein
MRPASTRSTRTTRRARPWARSEYVPWHGSRWFTGGYPTAKLHTDVDPSDGAPPCMAWPKAEDVDIPHRGSHGAQRVALACGVALPVMAGDWTARVKHLWTLAHLPDTVPCAESKRGGRMTERRSSPVWSMAPELNGGEGAGPSNYGATLGSREALGPAYGERGGVRCLGTDEVRKTEASAAMTAYRRRTRCWCG